MNWIAKLIDLFRPNRSPGMSHKELEVQLEYQRVFGVDMARYADADGRVDAVVCDCGRYRRDWPPGTYVCGCNRTKFDGSQQRRLMCVGCSASILAVRSSWATFQACDGCKNAVAARAPEVTS